MKIYIGANLDQRGRDYLQTELGGYDVIRAEQMPDDPKERRKAFSSCEVAFGNVPAEWLVGDHRLKWLQLESVGFEYYCGVASMSAGRDFKVSNLRGGMFARPVAETALAGILALYRRLDELIPAQTERKWTPGEYRARMRVLSGERVVVCGLGAIGGHICDLLRAFGCTVTAFARSSSEAQIHTPEELDEELPRCAIVINVLPNTEQTADLFNRRRLARFAPGALFVNVGRGTSVDETALAEALNEGRLGGTVLDVFRTEPLPSDHPLWRAPNTIITQHTGGGYNGELYDKACFFAENMKRYAAGDEPLNLVKFERGY